LLSKEFWDFVVNFNKNEKIVNGTHVGRYTYGYERICTENILIKSIGSFCSINHTVHVGVGNLPMNFITTSPITYMSEDTSFGPESVAGILSPNLSINIEDIPLNEKVTIGNDVWIATNVVILPGVKIGDGAILAAGAIVTKDVPDYAIVGGVPAKVLKYRYKKEEIEVIKRIAWWNWSEEEIKDKMHLLRNSEEFFKEYQHLNDK